MGAEGDRKDDHVLEGPRPDESIQRSGKADEGGVATLERAGVAIAVAAGASPPPDILDLQRSAGNRAVSRMVQTKLEVGKADDKYEREADKVADVVVRSIQRMTDPDRAVEETAVVDDTRIRRSPDINRVAEVGEDGGEVSEELTAKIRRTHGGGEELQGKTRKKMEGAFGVDFSGVRIHRNSDIAPRLGATAFTQGRDIHFAPGTYDTGTMAGQRLLSHELTHVVQQTGGLHREWDGSDVAPVAPAMDVSDEREPGWMIRRHSPTATAAPPETPPDETEPLAAELAAMVGDALVNLGWSGVGAVKDVGVAALDMAKIVPMWGMLTGAAVDIIGGAEQLYKIGVPETMDEAIVQGLIGGRTLFVTFVNALGHVGYVCQLIQDIAGASGVALAVTLPVNEVVATLNLSANTVVTLMDAFLTGFTAGLAMGGAGSDGGAAYSELAGGFGKTLIIDFIKEILAMVDFFTAGGGQGEVVSTSAETLVGTAKGAKTILEVGGAVLLYLLEKNVEGLLKGKLADYVGGELWDQLQTAYGGLVSAVEFGGDIYDTAVEAVKVGSQIVTGEENPVSWLMGHTEQAINDAGESIEQMLEVKTMGQVANGDLRVIIEQIDALIASIGGMEIEGGWEGTESDLGDNVAADALEAVIDFGTGAAADVANAATEQANAYIDELKAEMIPQLEGFREGIEELSGFLLNFETSINTQVEELRAVSDRFAALLGECESIGDIVDVVLMMMGGAFGFPDLSMAYLGGQVDEASEVLDRIWTTLITPAGEEGAEAAPPPTEDEEVVQRDFAGPAEVGPEGGEISAELSSAIASSRGEPLQDDVRTRMEGAFGTPLTHVRIHRESKIAPRVGATAFTQGRDVHFAPGKFETASRAGQKLLAHELTHVVQQTGRVQRTREVPRVDVASGRLTTMTLGELNTLSRTQVDWRSDPDVVALPDGGDALRGLLEWAQTGPMMAVFYGCVAQELVTAMAADGSLRSSLQDYATAFQANGWVPASDTAETIAWASALGTLHLAMGTALLHRTVEQNAEVKNLKALVEAPGDAVQDYADFIAASNPQLSATNGEEIVSYLKTRAQCDLPAMVGQIPHVRNLHHFEGAALEALVRNAADTSRSSPLVIVLHSGIDHNGAFHHDPNLTAVLTSSRNNTLLVEGAATLGDAGQAVTQVTQDYGQGTPPRAEQIMLAGHGETRMVAVAGDVDTMTGEPSENPIDLDATDASGAPDTAEALALISTLLDNLSSDPSARIVLNGCLTASNTPGNVRISDNPADRAAVLADFRTRIASNRSLADTIRDIAGRRGFARGQVSAANASFGSETSLIDPRTGELGLRSPYDPDLTNSDKFAYVRTGGEPTGALRAVVECLTTDQGQTETAMRARLRGRFGYDWDDSIIKAFYRLILPRMDDIGFVQDLVYVGGALSHAESFDDCDPSSFWMPDALLQTALTPLLTDATVRRENHLGVLLNELLLRADVGRAQPFLRAIGRFSVNELTRILDFGRAQGHLATLLPNPAGPNGAGELRLALFDVVRNSSPDQLSIEYLRRIRSGDRFPDPGRINTALGGAGSGVDGVLDSIREPTPAPQPTGSTAPASGGGGPVPDFNLDADGDGTNDMYVEPMVKWGITIGEAQLYPRPDTTTSPVTTLADDSQLQIIGRTEDAAYYVVEHGQQNRPHFLPAATVLPL